MLWGNLCRLAFFILFSHTAILAIINEKKTLELGDAACIFPEGISHYQPRIATLKSGGQDSVDPHPFLLRTQVGSSISGSSSLRCALKKSRQSWFRDLCSDSLNDIHVTLTFVDFKLTTDNVLQASPAV